MPVTSWYNFFFLLWIWLYIAIDYSERILEDFPPLQLFKTWMGMVLKNLIMLILNQAEG